ncbi:hypothetical protein BT96DRAFT_1016605 [Gymnopus androsaceus JB14]|uniref:Uncharacterized protein n=1 Tax=Gymnopus androsaceus JB14 TaxID=1447944 RepID=A0A6A4I4B2_9AGAR|nr:hypothetical protein BT96DRAFT_1016605 [Gymnopus androsaceus JB14]
MNLLKSFVLLTLASTSFMAGAEAQGIIIDQPTPGTTLSQGVPFTVQITRPDDIEFTYEVGLAIGALACTSPCPDPESRMGDVLYAGPFDPEFHGPGQQYQNFTVVIPASGAGSYQLGILRFYLIGAGPGAVLDQYTVPINVE